MWSYANYESLALWLPSFSPDEPLGKHPILLMTGWDLYRMVQDVLEDSCAGKEILEILYTTDGELEYDKEK